MRIAGTIAGCVMLGALLSGCDTTTDSQYFRYGIGTDLYSADIAQTTQLQDVYFTELCRQALPLVTTTDAECINAKLAPNDWTLIVRAGMNDVDRRCDAYLAWLDDRRRTNNAVLKELGDVTVASQAIMRVAGVSANPITLAGLAFGLASNTFTNINSRLLLEIDKTTVQTLVLHRRDDFRIDIANKSIPDRPTAIHALRLYLTICTPFAIETDINSTITVFQTAGASGLSGMDPLVNTQTIGAPLRATQTIVQTLRPPIVATSFQFLFEETLSKTEADRVLNGLCFNKNSSTNKESKALASLLVRIYQADQNLPIGGKLTPIDRETITKQQDCGTAQNYYEKKTFSGTTSDQVRRNSATALKLFVKSLNLFSAGGPIDSEADLTAARAKIRAVRSDPAIAAKLTFEVPEDFKGQVTPEMPGVLKALAPK